MKKYATISLAKEYLKFSAGHFTLFSASERERLHGHNFSVRATFKAPINDSGLCIDYALLKKKVLAICESLDEYLLLPSASPLLQIEEQGTNYRVRFGQEEMLFLRSDTLLLPLRNISVEELAGYILDKLIGDTTISEAGVCAIEVAVSSGPGQWGSQSWAAED